MKPRLLNIYTKARSDKLMATIGNQSASAEINVTPKGQMMFNNKAVQGAEVNTINKVNNQITDQSVAINYFTLNPLVIPRVYRQLWQILTLESNNHHS